MLITVFSSFSEHSCDAGVPAAASVIAGASIPAIASVSAVAGIPSTVSVCDVHVVN